MYLFSSVRLLLEHGAEVEVGDRYGTTPLVWAVRGGHLDIVTQLLRAGAKLDTLGMYAWSAVLLAATGGHEDVMKTLLEHSPNVNIVNQDGATALAMACKEGNLRIVQQLIAAGASVNLQDKFGDTALVVASKAGHAAIVDLLLRRHAELDTRGKENKTALYNAVEKNQAEVARLLLGAGADLELAAGDGNTPLLRAVKNRNPDTVKLLLDKKAKLHTADRRGDTVLHVAMRAGSRTIVETILRNPKHSQLLYKPNCRGETPYNIDLATARPILSQLFGARKLNTNDSGHASSEQLLGYEVYGAALATILAEPSLSLPITVGLYAKWGSGKGLLLNRLQQELGNYSKEWIEPSLKLSPFLLLVIFHITCFTGLGFWIVCHCLGWGQSYIFSVLVMVTVIIGSYLFLFILGSSVGQEWSCCRRLGSLLARLLATAEILAKILFCHPPGRRIELETKVHTKGS